MLSTRLRCTSALVLFCTILLVFATVASAAPPALTALAPSEGARFTGGFTVTFRASDADGLVSAAVSVSGETYTPICTYDGYWDGYDWDSWWAEDLGNAAYSCAVPDPGPGLHEVVVTVTDARGEQAVQRFSVTRTAPLEFTGQSPQPAGSYSVGQQIAVLVSGPGIATSSARVMVDGTAVTSLCTTLSASQALVTAGPILETGAHVVEVSIGDGTDAPPAIASWTFHVSSASTPPLIAALSPAEGSIVQGAFALTCTVTDGDKVDGARARVVIDDRLTLPATVTYAGAWLDDGCDIWWQENRATAYLEFPVPDLTPGRHSFRMEIGDTRGNWVTRRFDLLRSAALTAADQCPADGSRDIGVGSVSVELSGASLDPGSVTMLIDGSPVVPSFTEGVSGLTVAHSALFAEGLHTAQVTATDVHGSPPMTSSWAFVVDATPPSVSSVTPAEGAVATLADSGIDARIADADAVHAPSVSLTLDGAPAEVTVTKDSSGVALRWAGVLGNGSHHATMTAQDLAGNAMSFPWSFTVADPPRFGTVTPTWLVGTTARLSAPVRDVNADLDHDVHMTVDGLPVAAAISADASRQGTVTAEVAGLSNGRHTAVAYAKDAEGNEASATWTFDVDARSPVLQSKSPASGAALKNHSVPLDWLFVDAGPVDLSSVSARIDERPIVLNAHHETQWVGSGCDAYEVDIPSTAHVQEVLALHDGAHTARVTATDSFGQTTVEEWSFTVAEAPAITGVRPVPGTHTRESSVTISASVTDFDGIATTTVEWRSTGAAESEWMTLDSTYDPAAGMLEALFPFPGGERGYEFRLSATDAGGLETVATTSLYVDAAAPVMTAGSATPKPGAVLKNRTVSLGARFTDTSTIDPARAGVWIDGNPVPFDARHETQWIGAGCDAYEADLPGTLLVSGSYELHDGPHSVRIEVMDVFGYASTEQWSFTVQEAPSVVIATPASDSRTADTSIAVSARAADFDGVSSTQITWREANAGRPPGPWTTAPSAYSPQTGEMTAKLVFPRTDVRYQIAFTATDSGGLTTSASTYIFVTSDADHLEAGTACKTCHPTILQTHRMTDCVACHGTPGGPCDCHGTGVHSGWLLDGATVYDHDGAWTGRTCADCHSHTRDIEAQRHSSGFDAKCSSCHQQSLTAEHAGRLDAAGSPLSCKTCHASDDPDVSLAVANNSTDCVACHAMTSGHEAVHVYSAPEPLQPYGVECRSCHAEDLVTEHAKASSSSAAASCDACHPQPAQSLVSTWDGSCVVADCHVAEGQLPMHAGQTAAHDATANIANCTTGSCHAGDLAAIHASASVTVAGNERMGCLVCHADGAIPQQGSCLGCHTDVQHTQARHAVATTCASAGCHSADISLIHAARGCPVCHNDGAAPSLACVSCHEGFTHASGEHTSTESCQACHNVSDISGIHRDECATCHPTPRSSFASWSGKCDQSGCHTTRHDAWRASWLSGKHADMNAEYGPGTCWHPCHEGDWGCDGCHFTDRTPPATTSDTRPSYSTVALISLTATDPGGRTVPTTYHRLDGGPIVQGGRVMVEASSQPTHTLEYWSADIGLNSEAHHVEQFTIAQGSRVPPTTTSDALGSYIGTATINLLASDASGYGIASTRFILDGGPEQTGSVVVVRPPNLGSANHTLVYWSIDNVDNVEARKSVTFVVNAVTDATPPVTTSNAVALYSGTATILLSATDVGSGVARTMWRLDGGPAMTGTLVQVPPPLTGSLTHALEYWSVDLAGNTEAPKMRAFSVNSVGTGTLRFVWPSPPDGAFSYYYVYQTYGGVERLLASGYNTSGTWQATVPVTTLPYRMVVRYCDPAYPGDDSTVSLSQDGYVRKPGAIWAWYY